ncbi:alpha-glucan family phosphorylase [Thermodesulfobacterium hydrogeniphilum]|uniref:alpha-glucan family phosphorylase n=1 Tax=Thermodesulfobacterium hydrogeniphilum TaxID=161156 RepID=UPI000570B06D|nr:alpha-glucan family phosphorylase [Thermodesulfobacterium hydrogeniphilum]
MKFKKFFVYPKIPQNLQKLLYISNNLWFSWNYEALSLFYKIDHEAFRRVKYNTRKFLNLLPKVTIEQLANDEKFLMDLEDLWESFEEYKKYKHPIIEEAGIKEDDVIAYFCTEFGFHPSLPIYAGGLGILAGDMIIGASDLGLPLIGIGLLYKHGYLRQKIDYSIKTQVEESDEIDVFLNLLQEIKDENNKPLIITLNILDEPIKIKIWALEVGRTKCYLLDTDLPENPPKFRDILRFLYPGDIEKRILQEIILGMGGYYALKALGIKPKIYHLNEGHSAFVIWARLKDLIKEEGLSLEEAKMIIKETTVFTTHTPVISGNEHFPTDLVKKYFCAELEELFDLDLRKNIFDEGLIPKETDIFWLPALAIRNSAYVNAVSKLHQTTTKKMWAPIFEKLVLEEIPIDYVTNGVHWRWLSEPFYFLLKKYLGSHFIYMTPEDPRWEDIFKIPDEEIWDAHKRNKYKLVTFLKKYMEEEFLKIGVSLDKMKSLKAPKAHNLIITCARRITGYKRNTLILYNKEKIAEILRNTDTVLLFAGKAHPKDLEGKKIIQEILEFREQYKLYDKVLFLENYDLHLARYLLWGSDVWLNTPFRPMEASGTSGMKACMNGVLHLSVLDGWWPEGYNGTNGWAIYPKEGLPPYNIYEVNQIYTLLENEIQPLFYERDEEDIPRGWVKMMKQAIYTACRFFSMNRVLIEYLQKFYLPSLNNSKLLTENNYALLHKITEEAKNILEKWEEIEIYGVYDNLVSAEVYEEENLEITLEANLAGLSPDLVEAQVVFLDEIYCVVALGIEEEVQTHVKVFPLEFKEFKDNKAIFSGKFPLYGSGLKQYSVRLVPKNHFIRKAYPDLIKWKN